MCKRFTLLRVSLVLSRVLPAACLALACTCLLLLLLWEPNYEIVEAYLVVARSKLFLRTVQTLQSLRMDPCCNSLFCRVPTKA